MPAHQPARSLICFHCRLHIAIDRDVWKLRTGLTWKRRKTIGPQRQTNIMMIRLQDISSKNQQSRAPNLILRMTHLTFHRQSNLATIRLQTANRSKSSQAPYLFSNLRNVIFRITNVLRTANLIIASKTQASRSLRSTLYLLITIRNLWGAYQ